MKKLQYSKGKIKITLYKFIINSCWRFKQVFCLIKKNLEMLLWKAWTEYKRINNEKRTKVYKKKTFADIWAIYLVLILIIIQISTLNVELNISRPHITRNNFNLRRQLWYKAKDHYVANRFQQTCLEKLLMSWKWRKISLSIKTASNSIAEIKRQRKFVT